MLSSDIKPLKAGLQEKTQSSLILCVTWHLFGAAFLLHRVWRGIQIGRHWQGSSSQNGYVKIHRLSYSQMRDPQAVFPSWHSDGCTFTRVEMLENGLIGCFRYNVRVLESEALM